MHKIKDFLRKYWSVIVCAVFVGGVCSFGQYYAIRSLGPDYKGIPYLYQDNEDVYVARIREVVEGHYSISSPYFYEYKNEPSPLLPYGEALYALPVKLLHLDLSSFVHFSKFLFPAILFCLVFTLTNLALDKRSKITALAGASLVLLVPDILNLGYLRSLFDSSVFTLPIWTRVVNPITGALFLFSFFIILIKIRERSLASIIFAGILLGLMAGYFFSFAFASLTTIFLILILILENNYRIAGRLFLVFPIALLVSWKYFISQFQGILSGGTLATSLRNGLLITHKYLANNTVFFALAIVIGASLFIFCKRRGEYLREKPIIQFLVAGLLAGIVAFNQQIVTGKTIWPFHFVQYTKPFVFVTLFYFGYILFAKYSKFWISLMAIALVCVFGIGIKETLSYRSNLEQYREYQRYGVVADWLNGHSADGCVFIAKEAQGLRRSSGSIIEKMHLLLPAITPCDSYISLYTFFNVPQDRIYHNYLAYLRLNGVTEKNIGQYLKDNRRQLASVFFSDWNEMFYFGPSKTWLVSISDVPKIENKVDLITQNISKDYPTFMRQDLGVFLKEYRVDYLIYDKKYGGVWNPEWNKFLNKETELGDFVIYAFK